MAYIENLHAPDISDLGPSLVARTARAMISRGGTSMESPNAFRLITGFLITTDKAIREYCAGRTTLLDYCSKEPLRKAVASVLSEHPGHEAG